MCCFVRCYFANTKIDESFRTAKIRRTFFGNSLASKFAGCVRKYDSGTGRLRAAPEKLRFESCRKQKSPPPRAHKSYFSYLWGRNHPFISRKVLQSHMQFGFGTSAFFPIFVLQSAAAGCLGSTEKSGKFILAAKCISCLRCSLRRMAWNMVSYVITARAICAYCYKGFPEPSVG